MSLWTSIRDALLYPLRKLMDWITPSVEQQTGTLVTKPQSDAAIPVVYGKRRTAGTIVFLGVSNPNDGDDVKNDLLHLVIVWCEGDIAGIDQLYIDDVPITDSKFTAKGGGRVAHAVHFTNGLGEYHDPELARAGFDPKNRSHKLSGLASSYVRLEWTLGEDSPFNGMPNITADINGKLVTPVRGGARTASTNGADCLYDYLTNGIYGKGLSASLINKASFEQAATLVARQVPVRQGATETKSLFTCNVVLDTAQRVYDNVTTLLQGMRATLPIVNGQITLVIEDDKALVPFEISESGIRGVLRYSEGTKNDRVNRMVVEFADEQSNYSTQQAVWPEPQSELESQWLGEDNGVLLEKQLKVDTITNFYEARQMARVIAQLSRESLLLELEYGPEAMQLVPGDLVPVSYKKLGLAQKPFKLMHATRLDDGWFKLTLREHQPYIYQWLSGTVRPPLLDTNLPDPRTVENPSNFDVRTEKNGQIIVFWQSAAPHFDVHVYKDGQLKHADTTPVPEYALPALSAGEYEIDVRAANVLGYRSAWFTLAFEINKPVKPVVSIVSQTDTALNLSASSAKAGLGTVYEWRFDDNDTAVLGAQFAIAGLGADTEYTVRCRAINSAGESDWTVLLVKTAKTPDQLLPALRIELDQAPTWQVTGDVVMPPNLVTTGIAILHNRATQKDIASAEFVITVEPNSGVLFGEISVPSESITLLFDGVGSAALTVTAKTDSTLVRQAFNVIGASVKDLDQIKLDLENISNAVLEILQNAEQKLDFDFENLQKMLAQGAEFDTKVKDVIAELEKQVEFIYDNIDLNTDQIRQTILELNAQVDSNIANLTELRTVVATEDAVLAERLSTLTASYGQTAATLTDLERAFATETEATALRMSTMEAELGTSNAKITDIELVQATQNEANATRFSSIEASVGTNASKITNIETANATQNEANASRFNSIEASVGTNASKITNIETASATQNEANASRFNSIEASVGTNASKITNIETASATQNEANATRFAQLQSEVDGNWSKIVTVEQTVANVDSALSTRITQLQSEVGSNLAYLNSYFYTKANTDSAIAAAKTELKSQIDSNLAYLDSTFYTKANTDSAIASSVSSLRADVVSDINAVYGVIASVRADTDGNTQAIESLSLTASNLQSGQNALASRVSNVETTASGTASSLTSLTNRVANAENAQASANLTLSAHANQLGQLEARASLVLDVNGNVTAMYVDGSQRSVSFKADSFKLIDSNGNAVVRWNSTFGTYEFDGLGVFSQGLAILPSVYQGAWLNVGRTSQYYGSSFGFGSGNNYVRQYGSGIEIQGYNTVKVDASASDGELTFKAAYIQFLNWMQTQSIAANATSTSGVIKSYNGGTGPAFYASRGSYAPFTASHEILIPKSQNPEPGDIICDNGLVHIADLSNAMCFGRLSNQACDKDVRGVFVAKRALEDAQPAGLRDLENWYELAYVYDVASINAVGEGAMNVCGEGGDLQTNDYICASSMPGKGMRLPDDQSEKYAVAQVRHNVTFDSPSQVKQVAVIYIRG